MRYDESESRSAQREKAFTYHPPHGDQAERYEKIRTHAGSLSYLINVHCPPSRELSLAQTKIEEAVMWANAAIARNERDPAAPSDG